MSPSLLLLLVACDFGRVYYPEVGSGGTEWVPPGDAEPVPNPDVDPDTDTDVDTDPDTDPDTDADTDSTGPFGLFPTDTEGEWPCGLGPRDDIGVVTVYNRLDGDVELLEVADDCSESRVGGVSADASYPFSLWAETVYLLRDGGGAPRFWFRLPDLDSDVVLEEDR